jgi:hypothetical protein
MTVMGIVGESSSGWLPPAAQRPASPLITAIGELRPPEPRVRDDQQLDRHRSQIIPNPVITIGPISIRQINLFVVVLSLVLMTALQPSSARPAGRCDRRRST